MATEATHTHPMTQHQLELCSTVAEQIKSLTVRTLVGFYHLGCPDGIIAALLLKFAVRPYKAYKVILIPAFWDHSEEVIESKLKKEGIEEVDESVAIVEVDVVIPDAQQLFNKARFHTKIDHHMSQRKVCLQNGGICIDNLCAAAIVAEMFFTNQGKKLSKAMQRLLEVLDHKYRYNWEFRSSRTFQALWEGVFQNLRFMDSAETLLNELMDMDDGQSDLWISSKTVAGELLLAQRDDTICNVLRKYVVLAIYNCVVCLVVDFDAYMAGEGCDYKTREKARGYRAQIADILSSLFKTPVFIIATPEKEEEQDVYMISAGSSAECELTGLEIAQQFGGKQGHKHFAGFSTSHDEFNERVALGEKLELTPDNWKEVLLSPDE